ncbi:50S ribosomal protein L39e [Candidatus Micrarchaeota archaeon]|nr:MAG: 50S ribosomal protein L39e [Candidatus Micrarchaeota archaeon]
MARHKSEEKKKHLSHELKKNRRAPVWVALKMQTREVLRERLRHWRRSKLGKKIRKYGREA